MGQPRFMLAAPSSGSGKTLITCGILQAFTDRGLNVASFKCGPDYIDPMFHSRVIGTPSWNLDPFFTGEDTLRYLFARHAAEAQLSVMEGVMGYYDGLGGTTDRASAYDLARITGTPVILIVNTKGMSLSLGALIKGFTEYRRDSRIRGVILNQMSPMLYPRVKEQLERELPIRVYGYVPKLEHLDLSSRHLGLVLPEEVPGLKQQLKELAGVLEKTLELDALLSLAAEAPEISGKNPAAGWKAAGTCRIAVARDDAFCFIYPDNLQLLEELGAELVYFSPMHDRTLPDADGLLLYGGYPELHGKELEANTEMLNQIKAAIDGGMPCMAECGGFMYLHEEMEDMDGTVRKMAGVIPGKAFKTPRLTRFGYVTLTPNKAQLLGMDVGELPAHEFHYFDSTACGDSFHAKKPIGSRGWDCIWGEKRLIAGFPHLYYYGNPRIAARFLEGCTAYKKEKRTST